MGAALMGLTPLTAGPPVDTIPVAQSDLPLIVPQELLHLTHTWESALVQARIGADGKLQEWVPLDLPHYKLVNPLDRALRSITFTPAMEAGEPIAMELPLTIPLYEVGAYGVISETIAEHVESRLARLSPDRYRLILSRADELDRPLQVASTGPIYLFEDDDGQPVTGTVVMEFYVDSTGVPRLIRTVGEADYRLAEAAYLTILELRFEPPRRNNLPTVVRARLPVMVGD